MQRFTVCRILDFALLWWKTTRCHLRIFFDQGSCPFYHRRSHNFILQPVDVASRCCWISHNNTLGVIFEIGFWRIFDARNASLFPGSPLTQKIAKITSSSRTQGLLSGRCDIFGRKFISRAEEPVGLRGIGGYQGQNLALQFCSSIS